MFAAKSCLIHLNRYTIRSIKKVLAKRTEGGYSYSLTCRQGKGSKQDLCMTKSQLQVTSFY